MEGWTFYHPPDRRLDPGSTWLELHVDRADDRTSISFPHVEPAPTLEINIRRTSQARSPLKFGSWSLAFKIQSLVLTFQCSGTRVDGFGTRVHGLGLGFKI